MSRVHYLHGNAAATACGLTDREVSQGNHTWTGDPNVVTCPFCKEKIDGADVIVTHHKTETFIKTAEVSPCRTCGKSGCFIHDQITPALEEINRKAGKEIYTIPADAKADGPSLCAWCPDPKNPDPKHHPSGVKHEVKPTGTKRDRDKTRFDLIPWEFEDSLAKVLTFGAQTYGPNNWRMMEDLERFEAAARRHHMAHRAGEFLDPETKQPHLVHEICNLMFICEIKRRLQRDANPMR